MLINSQYTSNMHAKQLRIESVTEIVHPKMKMLSLFTQPHVIPNLYAFILPVECKMRILKKSF